MTVSFARELPGGSGHRYDLADYVTPQVLEAMGQDRNDSGGTAFALRALTDLESRTFDVKYPELKARQIFPVFTGLDPATEIYAWQQFDRVGTAGLIHDYSADMPSSEVVMNEFSSRCLSIGTSYNYSYQDIRRARMAGIPLETRKALAARRSMEQAFEQIAWYGIKQIPGTGAAQGLQFAPVTQNTSDPLAMYGMSNFPGLTVTTTTNNWTLAGTSVNTILSDFNALQLSVIQTSKGVHQPDTLILPLSIWSTLAVTARSTTFTDDSILQFMQKQSPWLKAVYWTTMLENAGLKQDGATPGPRILLCERNEENFSLIVPQEFEQLPPQMVNMAFKVPCHMRVGGIRVPYPLSVNALDGAAG